MPIAHRDPIKIRLRSVRAALGVAVVVTLGFGFLGCGSSSGKSTSTSTSAAPTSKSLSGTYDVKGNNPNGGSSYSGTVKVTGAGPTYSVVWSIGGQTFRGDGALSGTTFTVEYRDQQGARGVATYKRQSNGDLIGTWKVLGTSGVGKETWTPA